MIETDNQHNTRPGVWKRIAVLAAVFAISLVSLSLIVHIPFVQQWGIRLITNYLSDKTGSTVSVKAFDFNALSHFNLKDVYMSQLDAPNDTLLYAGELGVRFSRLWKLFGSNPKISHVRLHRARLYIDDRPLTFLSMSEKKSKSKGIKLIDPEVTVDDVIVRVNKTSSSLIQEFYLSEGIVKIEEINTGFKHLRLNSIDLTNPIVVLTAKPDSLIIPSSLRLEKSSGELVVVDTAKWTYAFKELRLTNGQFSYHHPDAERLAPVSGINYRDLQVRELNVDIANVIVDYARMTGEIREVSFAEQSGFRIDHIEAKHVALSEQGVELGGLELRTPGSIIMDSVAVNFGKSVEGAEVEALNFYARFKETELAVADVLMGLPELQNSVFFTQNRNEVLKLTGIIRGTPDRLRGDSLQMQLGDITFDGQFRTRDLTQAGKQVLNLVVNDAAFTAQNLERHIPRLKLPDQFNTLGRVHFRGKFDGFLQDFVAFGNITTDIGRANVDMKFESTSGVANYSGAMSLINFNLQKWTGIADLGMISANLRLTNGSGLTAETAVANVEGTVSQFQFKDYTYSDIKIDGRLDQREFNGKLEVHDPNIDLVFLGSVIANDGSPKFDFTADIENLDLQKLGLSKDVFSVEGVVVARGQGKDLNSLIGSLQASDLHIVQGDEAFALDTFFVDVEKSADGSRYIRARSDYVNGWISGDFELNSLYPSLAHYLEESYPQYFSGLKYRKDPELIRHNAAFELTLNQPEEWGGLVNLNGVRFRDLYIKGILNVSKDTVIIDIVAPDMHVGNVNAYMITAHMESIAGQAKADAFITAIDIDERHFFDEITASVQTVDNGFQWSLGADDLFEELNTLGLSGTFRQDSNKINTVHIDPQIIEILEQQWELRDGNQIRFGKNFIELKDVVFAHDDQVIAISDINQRGILIETQRFDLSFIDDVWDYEKLNFAGPYTLRASLANIFTKEDFSLTLDAPEVRVNGDIYGQLRVNCRMERMGLPVAMFVGLEYPGIHLSAGGAYYPPITEVPEALRNTLDLDVTLDTFPINFLEYFLQGGIRNTTGYAVGEMNISGSMNDTKMDGNAVIYDGATTISYLGTRYFFHDQRLRIDERLIDATGIILTDELGNTAVVDGGITHRVLGKLGLAARITSSRILSLNTQKADNSTYYGRGIGSIDARFTGQIDRPTISIDAITDEGTYIVINLADEGESRDKSFIRFRNDVVAGQPAFTGKTSITGMNFEMNMTTTPAAQVEIILEDDPPESIVGSGSGDIQLSITRTGDFTMFGQYEIDEGSYLFRSLYIINKPFQLRQGGTIRWDGDPYNADISLEAEYAGLRASLSTFLAEYLTSNPALQDEAELKTDVHLRLLLTGTLLQPIINFDLSFPNLSGELAVYADTKLRVLKSNQSALNEQVFGLLLAGSFLPSNILQADAGIQLAEQGIANTVGEFVSNQLSALFSNVISRWVGSDIDFDVNYSQGSQFDLPDAEGSTTYRELEVRFQNRLFNDRVILDAGANYITDNPTSSEGALVGDYAVEYFITQDGRLKIRFYHRNEQTIEGRKNKLGIGLAWRREFDSFDEWLGGLGREARRIAREEKAADGG